MARNQAKEIFERVFTWPPEDQEKVARFLHAWPHACPTRWRLTRQPRSNASTQGLHAHVRTKWNTSVRVNRSVGSVALWRRLPVCSQHGTIIGRPQSLRKEA